MDGWLSLFMDISLDEVATRMSWKCGKVRSKHQSEQCQSPSYCISEGNVVKQMRWRFSEDSVIWSMVKMGFSMISFMLLRWLWKSPLFLLRHHLTAQFGQWPLNSAFWGSVSATVTWQSSVVFSPKLSMNRGAAHGHDSRTFVVSLPFHPP